MEKVIQAQLEGTARKRIIDIPREGRIQKVQKGIVGFLVQHQARPDQTW